MRYGRIISVLCLMFVAGSCSGQARPQHKVEPVSLKPFLQRYLQISDGEEDNKSRYSAAFVDLNGDGLKEAIVYVSGPSRCGTGGCNTLILAPGNSSWRVVTLVSITSEPIRVLATKSHEWSDLGVWVQGGGIQPGHEALLAFDGTTYPSNPTVQPARELKNKAKGKTILSESSRRIPLYP